MRCTVEPTIAFRAPSKGCIHHTDRGSQYCSHDYQKILRQHGFKASPLMHVNMHYRQWMSGKGNCNPSRALLRNTLPGNG